VKKRDEVASRLDAQALAAAQLAVKSFVPEPQPDVAINVPQPPGGWDAAAATLPPAHAKPHVAGPLVLGKS
jgi:localization factor PodJL